MFNFFALFKDVLRIPFLIKNTTLILALAIPTGVPLTEVNKQSKRPPLAPDKTSKVLSV